MQTLGLLFKILSFAAIICVPWSGGLLGAIILLTLAAVLYFIGVCFEDTPSRAERESLKRYWETHEKPRADGEFQISTKTTCGASFAMLINLYAVTLLYVFIFNEYYALIELVVVPLVLLSAYLTWSGMKKYKKALNEFDEIDDTHTDGIE